jgi:hypothetical protein
LPFSQIVASPSVRISERPPHTIRKRPERRVIILDSRA